MLNVKVDILLKMQAICIDVKNDNIYRPEEHPLSASFMPAGLPNEGECPANDKCPLYQYCAAGRTYGVIEGFWGETRVKLLPEPNIVPWTKEHFDKITEIVKEYKFKTPQ